MSSPTATPRLIAVALACLAICYSVLAGSALGEKTVQWDEFTDLAIAADLAVHPLGGSPHDPSQARLPMYVTAAAYRLLRWVDAGATLLDALPVSRAFSIGMVILAIWATGVLGYRLFDASTAILAAAILSFSPLVLDFGRDALTQGDAYTIAVVVLAVLAFERFVRRRRSSGAFVLAIALGLAVAAKFTLVFLVPAFMADQLLTARLQYSRRAARASPRRGVPGDTTGRGHGGSVSWPYAILAIATGSLTLIAWLASVRAVNGTDGGGDLWRSVALSTWIAALCGLTASALLALSWPKYGIVGVLSRRRWSPLAAWVVILPLAATTTLALFPEHVFNTAIVRSVVARGASWDGRTDVLPTALASARLYLGLLLFKLGLPLGIATLLALVWAAWQALRDRGVRLIMVTLVTYMIHLLALPLQQPFWLMAVYPLIVLLLAAGLKRAWQAPLSGLGRTVVRTGVVVACVWLAVGVFRVYPSFGFYGYETLGDRWLGAPSRGYRSVVVVTNDGSVEAVEWLRTHAARAVVISSLDDVFLLRSLDVLQPFPFELRHAAAYERSDELQAAIDNADFLVTRVVDDLPSPFRPFASRIGERFGPLPVHQIVRGRGRYRMPVIEIYKKGTAN